MEVNDEKHVRSLPNVQFFTSEDTNFKNLILHHGIKTCRDRFDKAVISRAVSKCDFGYISLTQRAQIGRKNVSKTDKYTLNGFVLCSTDLLNNISVEILLICVADQYKGAGKELLQLVINYAESKPTIYRITLHSLPELQAYYSKLEFDTIETFRLKSGEIKVYQMVRKIRDKI